jgi:hypothetical protein
MQLMLPEGLKILSYDEAPSIDRQSLVMFGNVKTPTDEDILCQLHEQLALRLGSYEYENASTIFHRPLNPCFLFIPRSWARQRCLFTSLRGPDPGI